MNESPDGQPTGLPSHTDGRGYPELLVDHDAAEDRRIIIADDFGQRIRLSADQLRVLVTAIESGVLDPVVTAAELPAP
jgi:hypothetical protein